MIINSIPMAPKVEGGIENLSPCSNLRYIPCELKAKSQGSEFQYIFINESSSIWNGTILNDTTLGLKLEPFDNRSKIKMTYDSKVYILTRRSFIKLPEKLTLSSNLTVSDADCIGLAEDIMNVDDITIEDDGVLPDTPITLQEGAKIKYIKFVSNSTTSSDITYNTFFSLTLAPYYRKISIGGLGDEGGFINTNITTAKLITLPKYLSIPAGTTIQSSANAAIEAC